MKCGVPQGSVIVTLMVTAPFFTRWNVFTGLLKPYNIYETSIIKAFVAPQEATLWVMWVPDVCRCNQLMSRRQKERLLSMMWCHYFPSPFPPSPHTHTYQTYSVWVSELHGNIFRVKHWVHLANVELHSLSPIFPIGVRASLKPQTHFLKNLFTSSVRSPGNT